MPAWKMQAVGGFVFHGDAKRATFDVMSGQGTEENERPARGSDNKKYRNRCNADDYFPSQGETLQGYELQGCKVTTKVPLL